MNLDLTIISVVLLLLILSLYFKWLSMGLSFTAAVACLLLFGVVTPSDSLRGFSNEQLGVIVILLIVGSAFSRSRIINEWFQKFLGHSNSSRSFSLKMYVLVGSMSSMLNNTPLVAMFMPLVKNNAEKKGWNAKSLYMPLSFISILGGCVTLIGTSTNLIVNGLIQEMGYASLGIFDFTLVGFTMLLLGGFYLWLFSESILKSGNQAQEADTDRNRDFLVELEISKDSGLANKSIEEGGLRKLENFYLIEIIREERLIKAPGPTEKLLQGDRLLFVGNKESIVELTSRKGLFVPKPGHRHLEGKNDFAEIVISQNSRLAGLRVKDSNFRGKYDGAVIGVHRNGERLAGKIGEIELMPGDVLYILTGRDFSNRVKNNPHFYVLSMENRALIENTPSVMLLLGLLLCIALSSFGIIPFFNALVLLLLINIALGVIKHSEIINTIDFNLVLVIAMGLVLGKAIVNSGLSEFLYGKLNGLNFLANPLTFLALLFVISNLLSSVITSKAAVAIILPISIPLAHHFGLNIQSVVLIIAFGSAANFLTPFGYQTNLMVYGAGNYRLIDYLRLGLPLTVLYLFVSILLIYLFYY